MSRDAYRLLIDGVAMMCRDLLAVLLLLLASAAAAQEPPEEPEPPTPEVSPDQLFVRQEVNLRQGPSAASASQGLLPPGTFAKQLDVSPDGRFLHVKTEDGKEGWIAGPFVQSYRALQLRRQLEELPNVNVALTAGRGTFSVTAASSSCGKTFLTCPTATCVTDKDKRAFNTDKRTFAKTSSPIKRLTHEILDALQSETDHAVGAGGPPTADERGALLRGFVVEGKTYKLGDYVEVMGYIASDRRLECGGGESVNCGLASDGETCNQSDIHIPLVAKRSHKQWRSVVVEPIAQGRPAPGSAVTHGKSVNDWTPAFFRKAKMEGLVLLVRGRLFYDSEHLVNDNPNAPKGTEPKRITLWEIHPVGEILTCDQGDVCDPDNEAHWTRVGKVI